MMLKVICRAALLALAVMAVPGLAQDVGTLPGGASSLNESHGDWLVSCRVGLEGKADCAVSQQQSSKQNGQRVLAVELRPEADGVAGLLVLPFGLNLEAGIKLRIDEAGEADMRFRTCLPTGCLVEIRFDTGATGALRNGTKLNVLTRADSGAETNFTVSLAGFASALDRATELAGL